MPRPGAPGWRPDAGRTWWPTQPRRSRPRIWVPGWSAPRCSPTGFPRAAPLSPWPSGRGRIGRGPTGTSSSTRPRNSVPWPGGRWRAAARCAPSRWWETWPSTRALTPRPAGMRCSPPWGRHRPRTAAGALTTGGAPGRAGGRGARAAGRPHCARRRSASATAHRPPSWRRPRRRWRSWATHRSTQCARCETCPTASKSLRSLR